MSAFLGQDVVDQVELALQTLPRRRSRLLCSLHSLAAMDPAVVLYHVVYFSEVEEVELALKSSEHQSMSG